MKHYSGADEDCHGAYNEVVLDEESAKADESNDEPEDADCETQANAYPEDNLSQRGVGLAELGIASFCQASRLGWNSETYLESALVYQLRRCSHKRAVPE